MITIPVVYGRPEVSVKQYLYSIRDEQKEIEELKDRIYEIEQSLLPSGIRYDKERVQSSPQEHMSEAMAASVDYQMALEKKLVKLIKRRREAQELIDKLPRSYERQVLEVYFLSVRKVKLEDVASIIGYSRAQTYNIYNAALKHLGEIAPNLD